ncbi:MAG TPA: hypothetical protein VGG10_16420 [Rhizomicrobium sp.]
MRSADICDATDAPPDSPPFLELTIQIASRIEPDGQQYDGEERIKRPRDDPERSSCVLQSCRPDDQEQNDKGLKHKSQHSGDFKRSASGQRKSFFEEEPDCRSTKKGRKREAHARHE